MTNLGYKVLQALAGKTLCTAESCTGGGIGSSITAIPGSSAVYKGGIISYCNEIKQSLLQVDQAVLTAYGPVSSPVAEAMAVGARKILQTDVAVSVTGLAGPGGDEFGNPVGTVFIGCDSALGTKVREYHFAGDRASVRQQAVTASLELVLEILQEQ